MKRKEEIINWLQLSDLHLFESTDWNLMLKSYEQLSKKIKPDFIVITGDYRHKNTQYNYDYSKTLEFLKKIIIMFDVEKKDVFLIPGNHDVEEYNYRDDSIKTIISEIDNDPDIYRQYMSEQKDLREGFKNYINFVREFYNGEVDDERVNSPVDVMCIKWRDKLNVILLNTALISTADREHKEIIDIHSLSNIKIDNKLPTIVLGHHDVDSFYNSHKEKFIKILELLNVRAYLCGDTHKKEAKFIQHNKLNSITPCIICGKSAIEPKDNYSDVGVIQYTWYSNNRVYVQPYKWGKKYEFKKSDDFVYDIDEDFYFYIKDAQKKNIEIKPKVNDKKRNTLLMTKTYTDITEAYLDIANDIKEGKYFNFYGLRGATFIGTSEVNAIVKEIKNNKDIKVRFLISYPFSEEIRQRLRNIPEYDNDEMCEEKWRDTYNKVNILQNEYSSYENVLIRFHNTTLIFRFIITKNSLYLGYYEPHKNSVNTAMYRFDCKSPTYQTYSAFFDYLWKKSPSCISQNIPAKYSFLEKNFSVCPSLVINTTSLCNMNCIYCPSGGENLCNINKENYASIDHIRKLLYAFRSNISKDKGNAILRLTGGEPLVDYENRKKVAKILDYAKSYKKIVLCTNGVYFSEAYYDAKNIWETVKKKLLLKISIDTLNEDIFCKITGTKPEEKLLNKIINNIKFASINGFKIELNLVVTKENIKSPQDIIDIFEFACNNNLVGVKILTVNDFGGQVKIEQSREEQEYITSILNELIMYMREKEYEEKSIYLYDDKGILMKRFVANANSEYECTLTIVDHNNTFDSITPRRTFSDFCKSCKYYPDSEQVKKGLLKPCATGIMSLTLRADGILSPCRLCQEKGMDIKKASNNKIKQIVEKSLKAYSSCFHKTICEEKKNEEI